VDVALFSAGGARSLEWAPRAADEGAVLVVPEVNAQAVENRPKGIIANPNCSTIQVVVALKPLHDASPLKRVVMTTFQSVSGAGEKGRGALQRELSGVDSQGSPFTRPIAANAIPQIGAFDADGWSEEERKMINEPRKIMSLPELAIAPTCVRVPVEVGHSVQVMVEQESEVTRDEAIEALSRGPGLVMSARADDFPTPRDAAGRDAVYVGRVRSDPHLRGVLHFWVVADNLRKGAATNAVQIAELLGRS
jgi:aspartate-semialdehyde dehydrogenase